MSGVNPERIGRFKILALAAAGGMSTVYRAEDPEDGGAVAVKVLPEAFGKQQGFVDRFKREARIYMSLSHESIPKVYDFGVEQGRYYIAMEWLEGESLRSWLKRRPGLPDDSRWREMFTNICRSVAAAHDQGVLHRDLTEGNVIVRPAGDVRITDFGLSTMAREAHLTVTGEMLGTPHYSAPEQITSSKDVTAAADIWSLGVLGYQIATGRRPFEGENPPEVIKKILNPAYQPPHPRSVNSSLSVRSESILLRCLARDVPARYASVAEILHDLPGDAGEPVRTHPVISAVRRGMPTPVVIGLALTGVAVLSLVGFWLWRPSTPSTGESPQGPATASRPKSSHSAPSGGAADIVLPAVTDRVRRMDPRLASALTEGQTTIIVMAGSVKPGSAILLYMRKGESVDMSYKPGHDPDRSADEASPPEMRYAALFMENIEASQEDLARLDPFYVYDKSTLLRRTEKYRKPPSVIILRVFRLARPAPMDSTDKVRRGAWDILEQEVSLSGATPVLSDAKFSMLRRMIVSLAKGENPFKGKRICVTGKLSTMSQAQAEERLRTMGATPLHTLSKLADILVLGDAERASPKKLAQAAEWDIPTLSGGIFEQVLLQFK